MSLSTAKFQMPKMWNGCLIVGDCANENSNVPFSFSHLGCIETLTRRGELDKIGICAHANITPVYIKNGFLSALSPELIEAELEELNRIIDSIKPRVLLFLGRSTAKIIKPDCTDLEEQRGAPFLYRGYVTLLSFHPRELFMQYEMMIVAIADFNKAARYLKTGWEEPTFQLTYYPSFVECLQLLSNVLEDGKPLSVDIETNYDRYITCIGFAMDGRRGFTIPFKKPGGYVFSISEEAMLWQRISIILETISLIGQNAVHFDHYILAMHYKVLSNFVEDTMLMQWEAYCEMQKSLAFINSLYLDHPYWKGDLKAARRGKVDFKEEFKYNAKDCCVAYSGYECLDKELKELPPASYEHYRFNIRVSRAFQYMSIRGLKFDSAKRDQRVKELEEKAKVMEDEVRQQAGIDFNIRSPKQVKEWLYGRLKLPVAQKKVRNKKSGDDEYRDTADYLTMLKLSHEFPDVAGLMTAANLRKLFKRISTLRTIKTRANGYVGYGFNVVGADTGRVSSYKPADGEGIQAQNQDRRDRDLYLADDDCFLAKADLEGADSWTVAAMLSNLGYDTMMNDLLSGLKPAQALTIANLFGEHLITKDASVLNEYKKQMKEALVEQAKTKNQTTYDIFKAISHGSNYGMGPGTVHDNMFKRTEGELYVPIHLCKRFQGMYMARYNLDKLQERMNSLMNTHGYLDAFSGHRRHFYGRRDSNTVRAMLSHLPQAHTTYVTNLFLDRLMNSPTNRLDGTLRLIVQPVNQVHDETDIMFRKSDLERARELFYSLSENELSCWGVKYSIPFEANYGENWADCKTEL